MIVFDPIQDIYEARKDPDKFLDLFPPPLILDEVQFVPELLSALKRRVDQNEKTGQYYLTGSQNFSVLKSIAESMARRVAIFNLNPFTPLEIASLGNENSWLEKYLNDPEKFITLSHSIVPNMITLNEFLFRGTYHRAIKLPLSELETFFLSYIQTYVERDIRLIEKIENLTLFGDFLRLAATSTAQEINASHLGRELGISPQTARKWLNMLIYSYQWIELPPYRGNIVKRLSEKRKGYFKDTGLACHLMRISSPEALVSSLKLGLLFETWVVNYIQQNLALVSSANCYHWRAHSGSEVDLIIERNDFFYPIEIKCKSKPVKADCSGIKAFRKNYPHLKIKPGLIIHAGEESYPIEKDIYALSWKTL